MKQAPPLDASQLRTLVIGMRRRVATLPTAAERAAMNGDESFFLGCISHDEAWGQLSAVVAAQMMHMSGGEGFIFIFLFGRTLRRILSSGSGEKKHRLSRNLRCGRYDLVPTGRSVAALGSHGGFRFAVPDRPRKQNEGESIADISARDLEPPDPPACSRYGG